MPVRVLIADDHSMVRKGIRALLEDEKDFDIVGEVVDGQEVIEFLPMLDADVVLLDITMPKMTGIEVTRWISEHHPETRVLIFSMHNKTDYILNAVQYGASGYLLKETNDEEIVRAIKVVAAGDLYFPPEISSVIIRHLVLPKHRSRQEPAAAEKESPLAKLSSREIQVLECLKEGLSNAEIAKRFDTSPNTVANQRASILKKMGVKNTAELITLSMK
jgi:DNA-binding NarL/FixJ family response regulator